MQCVKENQSCYRNGQCCEGLQCDKDWSFQKDAECKPPRGAHELCLSNIQCLSHKCEQAWYQSMGLCTWPEEPSEATEKPIEPTEELPLEPEGAGELPEELEDTNSLPDEAENLPKQPAESNSIPNGPAKPGKLSEKPMEENETGPKTNTRE